MILDFFVDVCTTYVLGTAGGSEILLKPFVGTKRKLFGATNVQPTKREFPCKVGYCCVQMHRPYCRKESLCIGFFQTDKGQMSMKL